ncbi:MAG: MFS transporter [Acidimicrobiia bacterium]
MTTATTRRKAMAAVVAFGVVSLLADIVYEGGRSIVGPYLLTLGASASTVGLVAGIGEFVGYALRLAAGIIADRTRSYWTMTIAGYGLTVVAVPLLGLVGRVDLALGLVVAERLGKAIRSPARDTLLAEASTPLGVGWGFGLHEALDQTGAVVGPLLLAGVLAARRGDYPFAFGILAIPGVLVLAALVSAHRLMSKDSPPVHSGGAVAPAAPGGPQERWYLAFVFVSALGFAPFPLIAFHVASRGLTSDAVVPLMFAVAMATDAGVALISGRMYDRRGLRALIVLPALSLLAAAAFTPSMSFVWVGSLSWGAVMGIQESTLRAAVAELSAPQRRATAYGIFNTAYGLALLIGGALLGLLYEWSLPALVAFVAAAQVAASLILRRVMLTSAPGAGDGRRSRVH